MKYLIVCVSLAVGFCVRGQLPGFPLHANGLLYSDTVMQQLRHLADSVRSLAPLAREEGNYYSVKQARGRLVRVDTGDVYGAFDDLRKGISYADFVRKYPQADTNESILVLLDERPGYQVAGNACYYKIVLDGEDWSASRIILKTDEHYRPVVNPVYAYGAHPDNVGIIGNCVYYLSREQHSFRGKNSSDPYTFAYFLNETPAAIPLSTTARRLIAWRDRMLDTAVGAYDKDARWAGPIFEHWDLGPAQNAFDAYIRGRGDAADTAFKRLLAASISEVEEKNYYPFFYMEKYMDAYSPRAALNIRRRWRTVAMDNFDELTPRLADMHIAYLSAELGDWPVFLQAQLLVAIDPAGHYPDQDRPGYRRSFLRELEVLNIDIDEILLGNELVAPWPDQRFYRARVLGRALALEGGDRLRLETIVLKLIADAGLDDYHRLAMHYLFLNYESFLPADARRSRALDLLKKADETLPGYLSARVMVREDAVDNHGDVTIL